MSNDPLISVIVTTKNSQEFLENCLKSIANQTYKNLEIIVVDNNSKDNTKEIARRYTNLVFNKGPERSAQRNYGAEKSKGEYLLFIDSDMELTKNVVKECIKKINGFKALVIPEKSFGKGFWAKCKALERSFYVGVDWIEAARFFPKIIFEDIGGFDQKLISGEDWDLSQRVKKKGKISRVNNFINHNEGNLKLINLLKKKFYYASKMIKYSNKSSNIESYNKQSNIVERYKLFFSNPKKLFKNPVVGLGMIFMKTCELGIMGIGYSMSKFLGR